MQIGTSYNFFDINDLPKELAWTVLFGAMERGTRYLLKRYKISLTPKDIRKNFGWFKMFTHLITFIVFGTLDNTFSKIHLKPLTKMCHRVMKYNIADGLKTLSKTEPVLFEAISTFLTTLDTDYKVYKTTGIKSVFLQKYLPDLT